MRPRDDLTMEVQVEHDPASSSVELKIAATAGNDPHVIHLSRDEARRLAALILSQAARLDRPRETLRLPHAPSNAAAPRNDAPRQSQALRASGNRGRPSSGIGSQDAA